MLWFNGGEGEKAWHVWTKLNKTNNVLGKIWKKYKCPLSGEINNAWTNNGIPINKKELLTQTVTLLNHKSIMLSKKNRNTKYDIL